MTAPVFIIMFIALPETSADCILLHRARRLRVLTGDSRYKSQSELDQGKTRFSSVLANSIIKPFQITILDPAVAFVNLYTALIYGIYYSFFEVFPLVYPPIYGFSGPQTALTFITIAISCILGITIYFAYLRFILEPDMAANGMRAQEHRLVPALYAVIALPVALFWFAWTARASVHWIVGLIGLNFFGAGAFVM
jgi:DHA1 family multidrug resistance protein-like MFS transporter